MTSRMCSMCREVKPESEFRYMHKQKRYNAYCKKCERWYNKLYQRVRSERKKEEKKQ